MRYHIKSRDPGSGMTLGELRQFVNSTKQFSEGDFVDVRIGWSAEAPNCAIAQLEVSGIVTCPGCQRYLEGDAVNHPLSRRDNKTHICNACGDNEALSDFFGNFQAAGE